MTREEVVAEVRKDACLRKALLGLLEVVPLDKHDTASALFWSAVGIGWTSGVIHAANEFVKACK